MMEDEEKQVKKSNSHWEIAGKVAVGGFLLFVGFKVLVILVVVFFAIMLGYY